MPPLLVYFLSLVVSALLLFTANTDWFYSCFSPNRLKHSDPPDFERYRDIRVLSPEEFPVGVPDSRVIIVGDIHGMFKPFKHLLEKVAYDERNDILVHAGDVIAKGSHEGSLATIDYLATHNITGVRGNHDQKVIEWKGWQEWLATLPGGYEWLSTLRSDWEEAKANGKYLKHWIKTQRKKSSGNDAEWWSLIPEDWLPFGDHYRIAEDLTSEQYSYLLSLPLKLHIPSAHAFIIHAGLLPYNLRYDFDDHKRQPLARVPRIRADVSGFNQETIDAMRTLQELSVLRRVTHNTDPWVNLNIRSVVKDKKVSREASEGTPWTDYWNDQMSMCAGFKHERTIQDPQILLGDQKTTELPCYPSSVIFGHCAARGLDIGRWTFGLDSACVAGRKLTAMILGPNPSLGLSDDEDDDYTDPSGLDDHWDGDHFEDMNIMDEDNEHNLKPAHKPSSALKAAKSIRFGEDGDATIVHVSCEGQD